MFSLNWIVGQTKHDILEWEPAIFWQSAKHFNLEWKQ